MEHSYCMKCRKPWKSGTIKYMFNVSYVGHEDDLGYMCKDCYAEFLLGITREVSVKTDALERRYPKKTPCGKYTYTKEQKEDICRLYDEGYTIKDISIAYGFTDTQSIYGVLRRSGRKKRVTDTLSRAEVIKPEKEPDIKDLGRVAAYMNAGWSPEKIAYEFGVEVITAKRAINTIIRYRKQKKEEMLNGKKDC